MAPVGGLYASLESWVLLVSSSVPPIVKKDQ